MKISKNLILAVHLAVSYAADPLLHIDCCGIGGYLVGQCLAAFIYMPILYIVLWSPLFWFSPFGEYSEYNSSLMVFYAILNSVVWSVIFAKILGIATRKVTTF